MVERAFRATEASNLQPLTRLSKVSIKILAKVVAVKINRGSAHIVHSTEPGTG